MSYIFYGFIVKTTRLWGTRPQSLIALTGRALIVRRQRKTYMNRILRNVRNLIYPTKCIFCNIVTDFGEERYICNECRDRLKFCRDFSCCKKCGKPQISLGERGICYDCASRLPKKFKRAESVIKYDSMSSAGIKRYKNGESEISGKVFAVLMAQRMGEVYPDTEFDIIAGVAPSKMRTMKRGIDPVQVICRYLSAETGIPYKEGILLRTKRIPKQSGLAYEKRIKNLKGAIGMNPKADIKGKRILLVDDVMTTGTTLNENAEVLKEGGAKYVCAITLATVAKEPKTYKNG